MVFRSLLDLIYPALCLHCRSLVSNSSVNLCDTCVSLLELIDFSERCPYCFSSDFNSEKHLCAECYLRLPSLDGFAAAFDYLGPAATLVSQIKYGNQPYLAKGCGAYMAAQLLRMDWPIPDVIVPVPIAKMHWFERGYNQADLLAKSLAVILEKPITQPLKRKSGGWSQAGLSRNQRLNLPKSSFEWKRKVDFADKKILIVDDVSTTGSTLRQCAEVLLESCPASIYAITLCR